MNITYKSRCFWLFAAILWMALIFHFSNQKAAESSEISGSLTYRLAEGINSVFGLEWSGETLEEAAEKMEHPIRKMAHMTEYAILAWIFLGNCMQYGRLQKKAYLYAWLFASIYAATDEFHQLFIEGRSGEVRDAGIDSFGALFGLLFAWAVLYIWNKQKNKERGEVNG